MAATSLGLVGIVSKGDYSAVATYVAGNFVYHNYCTWLCIANSSITGSEPSESNANWQLLAKGINLTPFIGATASVDGSVGSVPQPHAGDENKFLKGSGAWANLPMMTGATASTAGTSGLVPAPSAGDEGKALMGDGTWDYAGELSWTGTVAEWEALTSQEKAVYAGKKVYITNDYMENIPTLIGASANDGGYKGLAPTPAAGQQKALLRGDGTWGADENLAPAYSSSSTYAVGELCTNLGKLWKCKTAISTAHAWNASEWDEVTISEIFTNKITVIADGVKTYLDLLNELTSLLPDKKCRKLIIDTPTMTYEYYCSRYSKSGNYWHSFTRVLSGTTGFDISTIEIGRNTSVNFVRTVNTNTSGTTTSTSYNDTVLPASSTISVFF